MTDCDKIQNQGQNIDKNLQDIKQDQVQNKQNKGYLKKLKTISQELQKNIDLDLKNLNIKRENKVVNKYVEQKTKNDFHKIQNKIEQSTQQQWNLEQNYLRNLIVHDDSQNDFSLIYQDPNYLQYIGGVDISFDKIDKNIACAQLVILQYPDMKLLYSDYQYVELSMPYVSGFLAFREASHILVLFERLLKSKPELYPQVLMTDGNGIIHQNGCGIASHLGVLLDIPSIGIGKTTFCVDGLTNQFIMNEYLNNCKQFGDSVDLIGISGFKWGAAMNTLKTKKQQQQNNNEPIIISIGHKISLENAKQITKICCQKSNIPEPVNAADLQSRQLIKNMKFQDRKSATKNNSLAMLSKYDIHNSKFNKIYDNGEIYGSDDQNTDQFNFTIQNSVFK